MRVAVYGAGAMGGFLGARMARAGHDLAVIARGEHLKAIEDDGLRVESPDGDFTVQPRIATDAPEQAETVDLVVLGVKAWQVPEAARALPVIMGPQTLVLTVQNGVEAPYQVAEVVPPKQVLAGVMHTSVTRAWPGVIRRPSGGTGAMRVSIGPIDPGRTERTEAVLRVRAVLRDAGFEVEVPADIRVALWERFLGYGAVTGVGALAQGPNGFWRGVPETRDLVRRAACETLAVAQARGVPLEEDAVQRCMERLDRCPAAHMPSAQRDMLEGRPSELDAAIGAVVRLGREVKVPTPLHEFMYAMLFPQELRARGLRPPLG